MGKLKLAITFDTTGSMYTCLREVRTKAQELVKTVFNQVNDVEIAVIAHGDYCDDEDTYITKELEFSSDTDKICDFIRTVGSTFGGDSDECYSLVLHKLNEMNWEDADIRLAIVIGDANPHPKGYKYKKFVEQYNWRDEAEKLHENGIKVYAVHALANYRMSSKKFYQSLADTTEGTYITLNNLSDVSEIIAAASLYLSDNGAYNSYIENLQTKKISRTLAESIRGIDKNFIHNLIVGDDELEELSKHGSRVSETSKTTKTTGAKKRTRKAPSDEAKARTGFSGVKSTVTEDAIDLRKLEPIVPGKYQYITVEKDSNNKEVFADFGPKFKTGLIYYELLKTEEVSPKKHVIIRDNETGDLYSGKEAREMIGLRPYDPSDSTKDRISAKDLGNLTIYIQSTSVNRKHKAGSTLLFELSDLLEIEESK